jgi:hypothetical protein
MLKKLLATLVFMCLAGFAVAQTAPEPKPLLSASRASIAVGARYVWDTQDAVETGIGGAYSLGRYTALVGSVAYRFPVSESVGFEQEQFRYTLGVNFRVWKGN